MDWGVTTDRTATNPSIHLHAHMHTGLLRAPPPRVEGRPVRATPNQLKATRQSSRPHPHTHPTTKHGFTHRPEMVEQVQGLVSALVTMPEYDAAKAAAAASEEFCRTGACV